ncbi:MAG: lamin tail domain-containing protein [candidate division KSB1 bacterium]|nr:lamin tail domain-containing protein [candidate division KSB1 bacterium]
MSQIILSEVMFDPLGSEYYNEFIEIFNLSATDTIDLAGWRLSDSADADLVIAYEQGSRIAPQQYAIILDPGYFDNSKDYEGLIPETALILTIDDAAFGSGGLSNSKPEPIILIASNGDTVAKYRYSLDNRAGYSDEKIILSPDDSPANWSNSKNLHGTPGAANSVRQLAHDVEISLIGFPDAALPQQSISLVALLTNQGLLAAAPIMLAFFEDMNCDDSLQSQEMIGQPILIADSLAPRENRQFRLDLPEQTSGLHQFYASVDFPSDEFLSNNKAAAAVRVGFQPHSIIINEIMYRPAAGQAEWFELYNPGSEAINLQQWCFSDARTDSRILLTETAIIIPPQGFLIIAEDSSMLADFPDFDFAICVPAGGFPSLNNNGDSIVLFDLIGTLIDQVDYKPGWGGEISVSLERKRWNRNANDPANWGLSRHLRGATPGQRNSIAAKDHDLSLQVWLSLAAQDSILIQAIVSNVGLSAIADFSLNFYFDSNQDGQYQASEWIAGTNFHEFPILPLDSVRLEQKIAAHCQGLHQFISYLALPEDEDSTNNKVISQIFLPFRSQQLVINEIMFQPPLNGCEWIELFYPTGEAIDLSGWQFSDANQSSRYLISREPLWLQAGQYLVIAQSADLGVPLFDSIAAQLIIPTSWPSLNNSGDQVLLYDPSGQKIDSVAYILRWCPKPGISLERIDFEQPGHDSSNWSPAIDSLGSTPGRLNSNSPMAYDLAITELNVWPTSPKSTEPITILAKIQNVGRYAYATGFQLVCRADFNHDHLFQPNEQLGSPVICNQILGRNDNVIISVPVPTLNPGRYALRAELESAVDEKWSNNSSMTTLSISFAQQSLVINEIMYHPSKNCGEWVELFNPLNIPINIDHWYFSNSDSNRKILLTEKYFEIPPQSFLVLAEDTSIVTLFDLGSSPCLALRIWPGLTNEQDAIFLFDSNHNLIDHVAFSRSWGGDINISLERISPVGASNDSHNWSSCVNLAGGTPGQRNSIFADVFGEGAQLQISPNPFSPDGDGIDEVALISYQLPFNLGRVQVKIFDARGRLVRFLVNNRPIAMSGSFIWDGRNDQGYNCPMGIYIIYMEALQLELGKKTEFKKTVVLAKPL